ncbi:MAG TPA: SDR family oxidoreductase [Candidatus Kryptonia bacterium]|nr:SDR family oxidoreductase [Candidatus Kryptonia bacterium]
MPILAGRVAVITGAASGIGRATAQRFANEGATVVIGDVHDAEETVNAICARGGAAEFVRTDVARAEDVRQLIDTAESRHGHLDVLVAAAGIGGGSGHTADYGIAEFDRVIAVNLKGVFLAMKYALPALERNGGGAIVTIASVLGLVGLPSTPGYSAAKGGVVQLTKVAALEYAGKRIRVNCICPGMTDTPMARGAGAQAQQHFAGLQPLGRLGRPDEIAETALFLASERASFVTGAAFVIDGGFTAQ